MNKDAQDTYYKDERITCPSGQDIFDKGCGWVHRNGGEIECNREGRYAHLVADMSEEVGNGYEFSICSLGLMGFVYARDAPALRSEIEFVQGDLPFAEAVAHISYSDLTPADSSSISIKLRQKSDAEVSFVTLEELNAGET